MWSTLMAPSPSTIDRILVSSIYHVATLPHSATLCAPMLWSSVAVGRFDDSPKHVLLCLRKGITGRTPKFSVHSSPCGRNDMKMKYSVHIHARAHSTHTSHHIHGYIHIDIHLHTHIHILCAHAGQPCCHYVHICMCANMYTSTRNYNYACAEM